MLVVCIARRAHRRVVRRARGAVLSRAFTADADVLLALGLCRVVKPEASIASRAHRRAVRRARGAVLGRAIIADADVLLALSRPGVEMVRSVT